MNLIVILATIRVIIAIEGVIEKIAEEIVAVPMTEIAIVIEIQIDQDHRDATDHVNETGGGVDQEVAIVTVAIVTVAIVIVETVEAIVVIEVATGDGDKFKLPILKKKRLYLYSSA